jgi:hypothetical protein
MWPSGSTYGGEDRLWLPAAGGVIVVAIIPQSLIVYMRKIGENSEMGG